MPNTSEAEKAGIASIKEAITGLQTDLSEKQKAMDENYRTLHNAFDGIKKDGGEVSAKVEDLAKKYAEDAAERQRIDEEIKSLQKTLQSPVFQSKADLDEADHRNAVELQRRIWIDRGNDPDEFREDANNLVDMSAYRSAARKLSKAGPVPKEEIIRGFTEAEKRAFDAGSLGSGFFSPELLGFTLDCDVECASMLDLYGRFSVTKSMFMAPKVMDYGAIGSYSCPATCDADQGPEGNVQFVSGRVSDFRGVFCLQRETVNESGGFDILNFMFNSAARSYRINRNRALISGDGTNEPRGWMTSKFFGSRSTAIAGEVSHTDIRQFMNTAPTKYGRVVSVMHPKMFAFIVSRVDANGRFIFGDGDLSYTPDRVIEDIRVSECLPDATETMTLDAEGNAVFASGAFVMATAAWKAAYYAVDKRPLTFEQYVGGSSMWCVKYQFWAQDAGFAGCADAGRTLEVR